jgi:UDPglucose 6-dehydrogenase
MGDRIGVVGAGYVGLTTAACLAHLGNQVTCVDRDPARVSSCSRGEIPILEPGLPELVREGLDEEHLSFTTDADALADSDLVFLCVPTPMRDNGNADLGALESALRELSPVLPPGCVLVTKSTVPVGTAARMPAMLGRDDLPVVSNPEFLREGRAVRDFLSPSRVVVGTDASTKDAARRVAGLYAALDAPIVHTGTESAELAKYASNAFLALKLSYVNSLAELCEGTGADITEVTGAMGLDERIGEGFLAAGPGWGGSCLPKDTRALLGVAAEAGVELPLVNEAVRANSRQTARMLRKIRIAATGSADGTLTGKRITLYGLTFKAGTADLRDSPALAVAAELDRQGARLAAHDPSVRDAPSWLPTFENPYRAAKDADAVVVLTEWPRFRELDWTAIAEATRNPAVVDTRNLLTGAVLDGTGFTRIGVGT